MTRLVISIFFAMLLAACSTSTQVLNTGIGNEATSSADSILTESDYIVMDYAAIRARTDDPLGSVTNPFPDDYRVVTTGTTLTQSRQGFRVQLLSTQNRNDAEIMLENYKIWLASQRMDHKPKGYIQFRAPFFRVHVGDYHDRNDAFELVKLMKGQFPDAWVVADTIDPLEATKN
jgi:hypothetical protein